MPEHSITLPEIRAYLASLDPGESCGIPSRPRACLVEKALEHKYPGEHFHVNREEARSLTSNGAIFGLPADVSAVVYDFDNLAPIENSGDMTVTRQQAEEAIPVLKGDNANG